MLLQFCNFITEDFKNWIAIAGFVLVVGIAGCNIIHGRFPYFPESKNTGDDKEDV